MVFGKSYYKKNKGIGVHMGVGASSIHNPKLRNHIEKGFTNQDLRS
jgi:hypothetical protein